jgi:threonine dehydrogenase-like Zn-dependent dehydrogenase
VSFGHLSAGLQTGYCRDTGGGWATELVAHQSQLYDVPPDFSDEMAVMVEPAACGVHAALAGIARVGESASVAVVGSGTLGLCVLAAVRQYGLPAHLMAVAKHPVQQTLAKDLGADTVLPPSELSRGARRITRSLRAGRQLTSGMDLVIDCVGSSSSLADALEIVRPRGTVIMAGMPGRVSVDLASMWHREVAVVGAYTYGLESRPRAATSFELAFELVEAAGLGRLVSGRYPLDRYVEALEHAGQAGQRGAIKVVFDLTKARVGAVSSPRGTLR